MVPWFGHFEKTYPAQQTATSTPNFLMMVRMFYSMLHEPILTVMKYSFDPATETFKNFDVQGYDGKDLVLHGLALRTWTPGVNTLYCVNHQRSGSVVSIFEHRLEESGKSLFCTIFVMSNTQRFIPPTLLLLSHLLGSLLLTTISSFLDAFVIGKVSILL